MPATTDHIRLRNPCGKITLTKLLLSSLHLNDNRFAGYL